MINDLINGKLSTSWWNRQEGDINAIRKPNIQNITNANNIDTFKAKLQKLQQEKQSWLDQLDIIRSANSKSVVQSIVIQPEEVSQMNLDSSTKLVQEMEDKLSMLQQNLDVLTDGLDRMKSLCEATHIYSEEQSSQLTAIMSNRISSDSGLFGTNDNNAQPSTSQGPVTSLDILRTLSRLEGKEKEPSKSTISK